MLEARKIANWFTISRFVAAAALLLITPRTMLFYALYIWCVASDIADGPIARKTKTASNVGALLDSIADLFFIAVVLIVFIPLLPLDPAFGAWIFYLIGVVIVTRLIAFAIGYAKHRTLTLLHTYSNKAAGLVMACFPLFFELMGLRVGFLVVFAAAFLSAFEEFLITILSKELDRNVESIFHIHKGA
jgi:CDP-diacylglycerol--glycerol-3-phosphate 3-phosphatidyltransferase